MTEMCIVFSSLFRHALIFHSGETFQFNMEGCRVLAISFLALLLLILIMLFWNIVL